MEENNNEEKVVEAKEEKVVYKKHSPLYWLIIILGMGFIVFMSVRMGEKIAESKTPSPSNNSKSNVSSNSTSNKEEQKTELTDTDKEKIANKLARILGDPEYKYGNVITTADLDPIGGNIFTNNFGEEQKLALLFKTIKTSDAKIDVNSINVKDASAAQMAKEDAANNISIPVFSGEEIAKAYKELYGTDMTYVDVTNHCPTFYYDSNSKNYLSISRCGGVGRYEQYVYIDEIKSQDNSIIITTYVGTFVGSPDEEVYYKDYIANINNITAEKTTEKEITSTNKTSFAKYNFTFEKSSDGEYYYKSVAKAN